LPHIPAANCLRNGAHRGPNTNIVARIVAGPLDAQPWVIDNLDYFASY